MSRWTLAIDPGIRGTGVALFDREGVLIRAAYVKNVARVGNHAREAASMAWAVVSWLADFTGDLAEPGNALLELAVEWPQVYASRIRAGVSEADPNDLLALTAVDAGIVALLDCPAASYLPAEWKGQLTKDACHERIRTRLDAAELTAMNDVTGALAHNAFDAIGIGLHHLGRFARRRVIPS